MQRTPEALYNEMIILHEHRHCFQTQYDYVKAWRALINEQLERPRGNA